MKEKTIYEFLSFSTKEKENYTGIIIFVSGTKHWLFEGKRHRTDGPAIEYSNGQIEYWYNGIKTTKEALELLTKLIKLREI